MTQIPSEGEAAKRAALAKLAAQRAVLVRQAQRALLTVLLATETATADDVRDLVDVPEGIDPVCLGAAPGSLARAGLIRRVGYEPSRRPEAHARPVSRWELADRPAAMRWLTDHPEIQDPAPAEAEAGPTLFTNSTGVAAPARRKDSTHGL